MIRSVLSAGSDLFDFLYPVTCLVCGIRLTDQSHLCRHCLKFTFEPSNTDGSESSDGMVLPDWIRMQVALWEFDKGGFLQDILHHVKYSGLADLGFTLGRELGYKLKQNRWMETGKQTQLLPVPLHAKRQRKRGYNQAALIAEGIAAATGAEVAGKDVVVRTKHTRTQTGLNALKRKKNITGAFRLHNKNGLWSPQIIIVDDVITTGATTMELASLIREHVTDIGIATIARA